MPGGDLPVEDCTAGLYGCTGGHAGMHRAIIPVIKSGRQVNRFRQHH
jgi:hypothetical protein